MTIKFRNEDHERSYRDLLSRMKSKDCYHKGSLGLQHRLNSRTGFNSAAKVAPLGRVYLLPYPAALYK